MISTFPRIEVLAFGLTLALLLGRFAYECHFTIHHLGVTQWTSADYLALFLRAWARPALICQGLCSFALLYPPLYAMRGHWRGGSRAQHALHH